jgi:hypothetical protein
VFGRVGVDRCISAINLITMLIESPSQEQFKALGKDFDHIGIDNLGNAHFAGISYISGIPKFDEALQGIPFHNTDCLPMIIAGEHGFVFALMLNITTVLEKVILMREGILDFEIEKNVQVEVSRFNKIIAQVGNFMSGAGALGATIHNLIESHKNKRLKFKIMPSKTEIGIKCTLRYSDGSDKVGEIVFSAANNSNQIVDFEDFIKTHWTPNIQLKKDTSGIGCLFFFISLIVIATWHFIL